ncbi:MAG: Na/Pi cotransporter family protein [Defluviitaleaceae bacterium]|nr:Na/Pi cotransporter family protein [Defluviitaleaceae bacterium]
MDWTAVILNFLGAFGLFLIGVNVLSAGLQKAAGCKMKQILGRVAHNRFTGVLFGAGVTALIQSSTATTVMAVGFVNAGIISLVQVTGIVMGANVGTTLTSWLVSSAEWSTFLKPDALGAVMAAGGALIMLFTKKQNIKNVGSVLAGFGVLFLGLSMMPVAVRPIAQLDAVQQLFVTMGRNPLLAVLVGIGVTAIIQSSTASIGILQMMAMSGLIPWNAALYIIIGQNVGSCFTAVLSSLGTTRNARATAFIHLVYNALGGIIVTVGAVIFFFAINPAFGETAITSTNISASHTGYNVALIIMLFPLGGFILKLAEKLAGKEVPAVCNLTELDESIIETPKYALENSKKAITRLTDLMNDNADFAEVDKANDVISAFLKKLYGQKLTHEESAATTQLLFNLERLKNKAESVIK